MKLKELLNGLEPKEISADTETDISAVCCDSRKCVPGCLFVAITGFAADGHKFIPAAEKAGAAVIFCEVKPESGVPYVLFDNTRYALAIASANFFGRPADTLKVIGVTGTNGKTTTTTLIKHLIESTLGDKVGLIGTNQNMIGDEVLETERTTPESVELQELLAKMLEKGCKWAVMEVSSHSLVLDRVAGIRFHTGVFSNLTQDHLDFHITMENYAEAKSRLFSMCDRAVINIDDEYGEFMVKSAKCDVMTYSAKSDDASLVAKNVKLGLSSVEFIAVTIGELQRFKLNIPGKFSVYNALAAIGTLLGAGVQMPEISAALATSSGVKGRVEVVPAGEGYSVLIDYAHTPDALENVLKAARDFTSGRVVALFGCGGDRDRTKRPKMGKIAMELADFVIVTSDNPRTEEPHAIIEDILEGMKGLNTPYTVIDDRREAIHYALANAQKDDVIILAGKGHETYQIIGTTKHHMDEREIVAEYFAK